MRRSWDLAGTFQHRHPRLPSIMGMVAAVLGLCSHASLALQLKKVPCRLWQPIIKPDGEPSGKPLARFANPGQTLADGCRLRNREPAVGALVTISIHGRPAVPRVLASTTGCSSIGSSAIGMSFEVCM